MRALRSYGENDIRVVDVDEPTPSEDSVIIDVEWCGICGSDLHLYHLGPQNMLKLPPAHTNTTPLILGHEIAGRISSSSSTTSTKFAPGTPVLVDPRLTCATCAQCTTTIRNDDDDDDDDDGEPQSQGCAAGLSFVGFSTRVQGGGFAAKVRVGAGAVHALPRGEELLRDAALVEPLAVAWHAVKRAGVVAAPAWVGGGAGGTGERGRRGRGRGGRGKEGKDSSALVVGGGPVGVALAFVLRAWGVGTVVVSEPVAARREGVRGVVDVVVDPVAEDVVERCKEVTDRFKGVDCMVTARISLEDVVQKGFEELQKPDNAHQKILVTPNILRDA
ncbi:hypothetical protein SLS58_005702 [Diplodia intermedia]|uniref:Alcohol dehydrogenase-like N-terminal domain-containing protein n=1 Tax=Diplodia intermedia TaxID=856260 RepID=A0ABR3TR69_9PEZI